MCLLSLIIDGGWDPNMKQYIHMGLVPNKPALTDQAKNTGFAPLTLVTVIWVIPVEGEGTGSDI